jgi:DNA-binding Lrp family transcriptional regulator
MQDPDGRIGSHGPGLRKSRADGKPTARRDKIALAGGGFYDRSREEKEKMRRTKLDRIDRRILQELQAEGRITNVELARRAGISAPPCLRRVRALEAAGIIRGYHAALAPEALGYGITVFALVGLSSQAEADLVAFERLIAGWPEVREAHMLAGEADFLLKIVATDWDSYQRFLSAKLTSAPNVSHVKSASALRVSKLASGVPIVEPGEFEEDRGERMRTTSFAG